MKSQSLCFWTPPILVALGTVLFVVGFLYDLNSARIPYQPDAPVELQGDWSGARLTADRIYQISGSLVAIGLAMTVVRLSTHSCSKAQRTKACGPATANDVNPPERTPDDGHRHTRADGSPGR